MVLDIVKGLFVDTAIATVVSIRMRAVNQLLLREIDNLGLEESRRFKHSHCTECPARSTASLVLDRRHLSLRDPIHVPNHHILSQFLKVNLRALFRRQIDRLKLLISEGSELIDPHLVGMAIISIVFGNHLNIFEIDDLSESFLFFSEGHSKALLPLIEVVLLLEGGIVEGRGRYQ